MGASNLPTLSLSKNWFTGTTVVEPNWDNIANPTVIWAKNVTLGFDQICRDFGGPTYKLNGSGSPILAKSLQEQINDLAAGTIDFHNLVITNTTDDVSVSPLIVHWRSPTPANNDTLIWKATQNSSTTVDAIETQIQFVSTDKTHATRTSALAIQTMTNGALAEVVRFLQSGTTLQSSLSVQSNFSIIDSVTAGASINPFTSYWRSPSPANSDAAYWKQFFNSSTTQDALINKISSVVTDVTHATRSSKFIFSTMNSGSEYDVFAMGPTDIGIPATGKFFVDGLALTGDTYFYESAANIFDFWSGGNLQFTINGVTNFISTPATRKFYLDGGVDTYSYESSGNVWDHYAGGNLQFTIDGNNNAVTVPATRKIGMDGVGGNDYWINSANGQNDLYSNGVLTLRTDTNGNINFQQNIAVPSGKQINLDTVAGNDYWINSANGQNDLYSNAILALRTSNTGTVTFPQNVVASSGINVTGTLNFAGGTTYNLSGGGNITARLGHFSVTLVGTGIDVDVLNISGVQTGAGLVNGIYFSTADGQMDGTTMRFAAAYTDTTALGAFYGRIPITIDGVGTKYISLYS